MIYKLNGIGYDSNSYLIVGKKTVLIDPGTPANFENLKKDILKYSKGIDYIINTHCHYDHVASDYLFQEEFKAPVYIHPLELPHLALGDEVTVSRLFGKLVPPKEIYPITEAIEMLNELGIEVLETPGHSIGGISLIYDNSIISGDTLFSYGVGRYDFPTGSLVSLRKSIGTLERIAYEKKIMKVFPGHGETGDLSAFANAMLFI
ncbi:beta-lactamase domain protein [Methanococcus vannielii SB]|jgi:glyoxylase-like metal-dependent hydrolase (beta-lactamase superfamily II)|uniref:Beta-lactamase domain protein n=1 Tax=Methanococcus vannielii (strain ATCC 35089 / DSM 1224 / JCM 13029 / OCM 148 / SB) TaxID=406327 RepID=A6URA1_METVS|nr:MBL fold metallo-hydrolase [Methanococcus vannielii]ABR55023.1 beta-lactamase domain protein [Methanococcus vannielii SB]